MTTTEKTNITELVFIIDKSGSMSGLESDTIGGFNSVLTRNREIEGAAFVTTVLFDTRRITLHDRLDIHEVRDMTPRDYMPGGCTALLDTVGHTIEHIDRIEHYMPASHKADNVVFVIITDGYENSSHRFSYPKVKRMIEEHQERGWEFLFLGANIDVAAESSRLGIKAENAVEYLQDGVGTHNVYASVGNATCASRTGRSMSGWSDQVRADTNRRRSRQ